MQSLDLLAKLEDIQAIIKDSHIVYTSGKHGSAYVNKDAIYPHTELTSKIGNAIAQMFQHMNIDAVVAPVIGGVILSQWVAFHLTQLKNKEILAIYAEKSEHGFELKRGYADLIKNHQILVVEDILNTGGSVKKVIQMLDHLGAKTMAVGAICNRGGVSASHLGVPLLKSLLELDLKAWDSSDCPLCKNKIPINETVGKGKAFIQGKVSKI
ncbi:MAG: hypothetical protein KDD48_05065 [Bdellovibrionales bacterium]|nr:hypothetical protein [Bdellovibrionales bacterium]